MFSDVDINNALEDYQKNPGEGIFIEPIEPILITPVGYDLRVGEEGFSWNKKSIIDIKNDGFITIDANDTVIIKTFESITVSKKISCTLHSIVSKSIPKGFSDISTTIDPGWKGKLLIAIHNHLDTSTELKFQERFCTVCFYQVGNQSVVNRGTSNNREDIWDQFIEKARSEKSKMQEKARLESQTIDNENKNRSRLLSFLIFGTVFGGIIASFVNSTLGASVAAFLAVIAPVIYDRFLKPVTKL